MHAALRRSLRGLVLPACLVLALVLVMLGFVRAGEPDHPQLNVEVDVSNCSTASYLQVYFDLGDGIKDENSVCQPIAASAERQRLIFPLSEGAISSLRIDPLAAAGTVVIDAIRFVDRQGHDIERIDLHTLTDSQQLANVAFHSDTGALELTTEPDATDPQFVLQLSPPVEAGPPPWLDLYFAVLPDLIPYSLWLDVVGLFWLVGLVLLVRRWLAARWPAWQVNNSKSRRPFRRITLWLAVPAIFYAWLLTLNLGHTSFAPDSESSWSAVLTYAVAHHWQFGRQVLLTYGPAMPLMMSAFNASIEAPVILGQLLCKGWFIVLLLWMGWRLPPARRVVFWAAALVLFSGVSAQALFSFSVVMIGLLFARGERADRWLLVPSCVYLATVTMVKVSFLLSAVFMLAVVSVDLWRQRKWYAPPLMVTGFLACFCVEWCLFKQHLGNLPIYLRGSLEMVSGFTQAMGVAPDPGVLVLALCMVLAAVGQLVLLFLPDRRPRWADLPMLALLAGGLLLSWKASFVRADSHVFDWFAYAAVSAAAAPAFVWPRPGAPAFRLRRWLEPAFLGIILFADAAAIPRVSPDVPANLWAMLTDRSLSQMYRLFHPQAAALAERQEINASRAANDLPRTREAVSDQPVDMMGDEQAVALLNRLNFRPRPSFLAYSTYTPWLIDLNVAHYCSPQAPEFVLFKLVSIDHRMPTLQMGPLLIVLAEFYTPILTENGYVLFQRREQPQMSAMPPSFELIREGDFSIGDGTLVPPGEAVWCQLEMRETLLGKLQRLVYQQPMVQIRVDTKESIASTRYIPAMGSSGFLLNPALGSAEDFVAWMEGKPLTEAAAVRVVKSAEVSRSFQKRMHYKFYRVPTPPVPPPMPEEEAAAATPPEGEAPAAPEGEATPAPEAEGKQ